MIERIRTADALPSTLEVFAYGNRNTTNYQTADAPPLTLGSLHGDTVGSLHTDTKFILNRATEGRRL
jgi:hypothetical protein